MNQYLIAANSKRAQLIFNMFRWIDLAILGCGTLVTLILFFIFEPASLGIGILVLLPLAVCGFLVMPVANYHNVLCILQNIYIFYFGKEKNQLVWKGWSIRDEFKE